MRSDININSPIQIFQDSTEYIFWKDTQGAYQGCNNNFAKIAGVSSPQEIIGMTDDDMPWGKYTGYIYKEEDQEILRAGKAILGKEVPMKLGEDLQEITLSVSKLPLYDGSSIVGIIGVYIDITFQKEREQKLLLAENQARAASKAKIEFLHNISHDLRTPIAGIISCAELLSQLYPDNIGKELVNGILSSSEKVLDKFTECLQLLRYEAGDIQLYKEKFSLKEVVESMYILFKPAVDSKNLLFDVQYDENIPKMLIGGKACLDRILTNIVSNAIKFTPAGSVKLKVSIQDDSSSNDDIKIRIIVEDTGIGIPAEKQATIFEKFTRLTPSYQGTYEGTGIGLYFVDKYIKALGGTLNLESKVREGSRFTVIVPFKVVKEKVISIS